ncbi:hypothetical protein GCM10011610_34280 [Nocardia rhizosphaerihabitans]|uniref:Uncharacterized protein n=1 Tax=Nocardia rhizosphaerihabitans TaxID=1691570 RepID=A0ABQ2KGI1_9NOCA|nr:hypothetical protein GCM10011610_34280 [Nocardia rhizosphaerihabitans]
MSRQTRPTTAGQPPAEIADFGGVGACQPQPRLLDRIVGVGERAEHPVGHRTQVGAVFFEPVGQELRFVHGVLLDLVLCR